MRGSWYPSRIFSPWMGTHLHVVCTGHPRAFPTFPRHPTLFTALSFHSGAENPAYISEGRVLSSWVKRQCSKVRSAGCLGGEALGDPVQTTCECLSNQMLNILLIFQQGRFSTPEQETFMHHLCPASQLSDFSKKKDVLNPFQGIHDFLKKQNKKQITYDFSMKMGYGYVYMYSYAEERICICVCSCVRKDFILVIFSWNRKEGIYINSGAMAPWGGVVLSCFCNYNFMIWLGFFGSRGNRRYNVKGWIFIICFLIYLLGLYILVLPSHYHFLSCRRHFPWHLSPTLVCVRVKAFTPMLHFQCLKDKTTEKEKKVKEIE